MSSRWSVITFRHISPPRYTNTLVSGPGCRAEAFFAAIACVIRSSSQRFGCSALHTARWLAQSKLRRPNSPMSPPPGSSGPSQPLLLQGCAIVLRLSCQTGCQRGSCQPAAASGARGASSSASSTLQEIIPALAWLCPRSAPSPRGSTQGCEHRGGAASPGPRPPPGRGTNIHKNHFPKIWRFALMPRRACGGCPARLPVGASAMARPPGHGRAAAL